MQHFMQIKIIWPSRTGLHFNHNFRMKSKNLKEVICLYLTPSGLITHFSQFSPEVWNFQQTKTHFDQDFTMNPINLTKASIFPILNWDETQSFHVLILFCFGFFVTPLKDFPFYSPIFLLFLWFKYLTKMHKRKLYVSF